MIRRLEKLTNTNVQTDVPFDDKNVMSLFLGPEALGITSDDIDGCPTGSLGLPELGTDFVIQMLVDTKPTKIADLVRLAGLSHGTDVWLGNAQTLIQEGKCTISTAICTRDDIMVYLMDKGIEPQVSFDIMEHVRKGRGLLTFTDKDPEMASMTGGGVQTPGFMGHGKHFISSKKFMKAEGGIERIVWMPKELKEFVAERLNATAKELYGIDNFTDMIGDETVAEDPETLVAFLTEKGHPALSMDPMM